MSEFEKDSGNSANNMSKSTEYRNMMRQMAQNGENGEKHKENTENGFFISRELATKLLNYLGTQIANSQNRESKAYERLKELEQMLCDATLGFDEEEAKE